MYRCPSEKTGGSGRSEEDRGGFGTAQGNNGRGWKYNADSYYRKCGTSLNPPRDFNQVHSTLTSTAHTTLAHYARHETSAKPNEVATRLDTHLSSTQQPSTSIPTSPPSSRDIIVQPSCRDIIERPPIKCPFPHHDRTPKTRSSTSKTMARPSNSSKRSIPRSTQSYPRTTVRRAEE